MPYEINSDDHHRVMLRELAGTGLDYINASFINVRTNQTLLHYPICFKVILWPSLIPTAGLQAARNLHCYSDSNGEHSQ